MKRREFFQLSLAATSYFGLSLYSLPTLAATGLGSKKKVVVVFLRGGVDVLSLLPPRVSGDAQLNHLSHPLANFRSASDDMAKNFLFSTKVGSEMTTPALAIGNHPVWFHPGLDGIKSLIESPNFALFLHTGSLNETRSHFEQMDFIESGSTSRRLPSGYLARAAKIQMEKTQIKRPLIAVGRLVPYSFLGGDVAVFGEVSELKDNYMAAAGVVHGGALARRDRLDLLKNTSDANCEANAHCRMIAETQASYEKIEAGFKNFAHSPNAGGFVRACEIAAQLSNSESNPSLMTIDLGGWDHHFNENPTNDKAIFAIKSRELASGLQVLNNKMSSDTVVVVMSEFGRTVVANASMGTDHGRGSAMMVFGKAVRRDTSKLLSANYGWDLSSLKGSGASRALDVKIDYREILGEVLDRHLGVSLSTTLLGNPLPVATVFDDLTSYKRRGFIS